MKLRQLTYICEIVRNHLNVTATAERLYTSQPGISKQVRLLEDELGLQIFVRSGKQFTGLTAAGQRIVELAQEMLHQADNILDVAKDFTDEQRGDLAIATTHTQARYALPKVVASFIKRYPDVTLQLHQGSPLQIAELAANGEVDFAIATEAMHLFEDLVMMPCYSWNRCVITPCDHPLREVENLTLSALAEYPLVTYVFGFTGRSQLDIAFEAEGVKPHVVFTATDADVIKTYVRLGLGVGIIARMAYDPAIDSDLCALDAGHLFHPSITRIGFKRHTFLRGYMVDFIGRFAPHITPERIEAAQLAKSPDEMARLFDDIVLPDF